MAKRQQRLISGFKASFTARQERAHRSLRHAIADHLDNGGTIECIDDYAAFEHPKADPDLCYGCPVLELCGRYADTGAVEHGIIAGERMTPTKARQLRHAHGLDAA